MLPYQDIKIPSVTSQTSGIPLQNCGSHYDFVCLAAWPFLWLRSGAAFVNGDITGTKVGPFLLNSNFRWGVGDWLGMYEGTSRGPSILLVRAGDMLARGPAVPADSVCEAMWTFETGGLWASPIEWCCGHFPQVWCFGHRLKGCQDGHHPPWSALKSSISAHSHLVSALGKHYPGEV